MNELSVLRRQNAKLRLENDRLRHENIALHSQLAEKEQALIRCVARYGVKIHEVMDYIRDQEPTLDQIQAALAAQDGEPPTGLSEPPNP